MDHIIPAPGHSLKLSRTYDVQLNARDVQGALGTGWRHFWEKQLTVDDQNNVKISFGGDRIRKFYAESSWQYRPENGDFATLTVLSGNKFSLLTQDGYTQIFDASGRLESIKDLNGNAIEAVYSEDRLTSLTHSSGASLTLSYNAEGRISELTDHLEHTTVYSMMGTIYRR